MLLPAVFLAPLPFLSPVFSSHMVLQRDRTNVFWGWTVPGEKVTVTIGEKKASGKAGADGKWMVRMPAPPVGGPYGVAVDGSQHVQLEDVLVGDVWICSGQSNMEMGIGLVNNAQNEIAAANYPEIRLFNVTRAVAASPQAIPVGSWAVCTPQTIAANGWGGFTAVGYFFGRDLYRHLKVPIGLVETSWGGTIAESWTSRAGLSKFPEFQPAIKAVESIGAEGTPGEKLDRWYKANDKGSSEGWENPTLNDAGWKVAEPTAAFSHNGLGAFDGVVWFRKEFTLPEGSDLGAAALQLGTVDDLDTTWVNGQRVGEGLSYGERPKYTVPASLLKIGRNVIAVRVLDTGGEGGIMVPAGEMLTLANGQSMPLGGMKWRLSPGAQLTRNNPLPAILDGNPNVPTLLYNGMIAPIVPLAIKGAIWYQGESNADRALQYQRLLPAMIGDWRKSWGQGDFPFFIVQLANFSQRHADPVEDAWAELREAQAMTARNVKNAGLAVAIDIGDRGDIHPKDKQTVGHRLALAALKKAYAVDIVYSGPEFKSAGKEGAKVRVIFDHAEGGLKAAGGKVLGFQLAGADKKYVWATATIDGSTVVVSAPGVGSPMYIRYAWDTDPEATLYNGSDLPAIPFRGVVR